MKVGSSRLIKLLACATCVVGVAAAHATERADLRQVPAYFSFVSLGEPKIDPNEFIVQVTDPEIASAFRLMIVNSMPQPPVAFKGTVEAGRAPYNEAWAFHVRPETLQLTHIEPEVCDASPEYIEGHLHEVGGSFLPGATWCPWSFRISREVLR